MVESNTTLLQETTVSLNAKLGAYWMGLKFMSCNKQSYSCVNATRQLAIGITQDIVTVPKYGHGTLHIQSWVYTARTDILRYT